MDASFDTTENSKLLNELAAIQSTDYSIRYEHISSIEVAFVVCQIDDRRSNAHSSANSTIEKIRTKSDKRQ